MTDSQSYHYLATPDLIRDLARDIRAGAARRPPGFGLPFVKDDGSKRWCTCALGAIYDARFLEGDTDLDTRLLPGTSKVMRYVGLCPPEWDGSNVLLTHQRDREWPSRQARDAFWAHIPISDGHFDASVFQRIANAIYNANDALHSRMERGLFDGDPRLCVADALDAAAQAHEDAGDDAIL